MRPPALVSVVVHHERRRPYRGFHEETSTCNLYHAKRPSMDPTRRTHVERCGYAWSSCMTSCLSLDSNQQTLGQVEWETRAAMSRRGLWAMKWPSARLSTSRIFTDWIRCGGASGPDDLLPRQASELHVVARQHRAKRRNQDSRGVPEGTTSETQKASKVRTVLCRLVDRCCVRCCEIYLNFYTVTSILTGRLTATASVQY